ncbi:MAG: YbhB/YbcL family Raf kinase inhibitor-like protein [Myxococcales bacterium]|nr:YbhB/YbcL family Raf kinase inhibitor-like protein [Myxococcales bacterium]
MQSALPSLLTLVLTSSLVACSRGDDGAGDGGLSAQLDARVAPADAGAVDAMARATDTDAGAQLSLASSALQEGAEIPAEYTCAGQNISPPFTWAGGPEAQGYAMVFRDVHPGVELIHSIIYDIPSDVFGLPEGVEKVAEPSVPAGAKQTTAYSPSVRGYLGPCPGSQHTYEFRLYAIDTYPLPSVTINSSRSVVETAILANASAVDIIGIVHTP